MNEAEAYGRVIDLIVEDALDYKKITLALAKKAPKVLIALAGDIAEQSERRDRIATRDRIAALVDPFLARNQKVGAIKVLRELTGWGLKEAKDYVDIYASGGVLPDLRTYANPAWLAALEQTAPAKHNELEDADESVEELLADLNKHLSTDPADRYEEGGQFA